LNQNLAGYCLRPATRIKGTGANQLPENCNRLPQSIVMTWCVDCLSRIVCFHRNDGSIRFRNAEQLGNCAGRIVQVLKSQNGQANIGNLIGENRSTHQICRVSSSS
jgi:hypothetical protein